MIKIINFKLKILNGGFTLVEAMTSVAIFALLIVGVIAIVPFVLQSAKSQSLLLTNNQQATKAVFTFMKEIRNTTASATGSYAIATANNQQLIFYTDNGTTVDRINYFIQSGTLRKGVTKPTGTPPAYNLGQEVVTTIQNDVANGATPLFYYYNDTYNGVTGTALAQPVNLTAVRFIRMNLSIYNKGGRANQNTYTTTAGSTIRSLKTNLGD